jgi:hypothetical protein
MCGQAWRSMPSYEHGRGARTSRLGKRTPSGGCGSGRVAVDEERGPFTPILKEALGIMLSPEMAAEEEAAIARNSTRARDWARGWLRARGMNLKRAEALEQALWYYCTRGTINLWFDEFTGFLAGVNPGMLRNVDEVMVAAFRAGLAVAPCFNARGGATPPLLVFPGRRECCRIWEPCARDPFGWRSPATEGMGGSESVPGVVPVGCGVDRPEADRNGDVPSGVCDTGAGQRSDTRDLAAFQNLGGEGHHRDSSSTPHACDATDRRVLGAFIQDKIAALPQGLRQGGCFGKGILTVGACSPKPAHGQRPGIRGCLSRLRLWTRRRLPL